MNKNTFVTALLLFYAFFCGELHSLEHPELLTATPGNGKIELVWTPVAGAISYEIFRSTDNDTGFSLVSSTMNEVFLDTPLTNNTTYYYYVKTYDGYESGSASAVISSTPRYNGIISFYRFSDFIFFFNPWIIETNGTAAQSSLEQEIHLSEGIDDIFYSSSPSPYITTDREWIVFAEKKAIIKKHLFTHTTYRIIDNHAEQEQGFSVSPDEKTVAYIKKSANANSIYLVDIDGGNEKALLADGYNNRFPYFSPDMQHVIFVTNKFGSDEIASINLTTLAVSRITTNTLAERYPRYSHTGQKIAFHAFLSSANSNEIYTINANGTGLLNITGNTPNYEYFPVWSPDDTKLAFILRIDQVINQQTYLYFHVKTQNADGTGSASFLTNSANKIVRAGLNWQGKTDAMAPRPVIDLESSSSGAESVTLLFTAPGDDGSTGQAHAYRVYYSPTPFSEENLAEIPYRELANTPLSTGSYESIGFDRLTATTLYYFALKTLDEQSNMSGLSNIVTGSTHTSADNTAPVPPSGFTATAKDFLRIELSWDHSPSSDTTGYTIYRNSLKICELAYLASHIDQADNAGATLQYEIRARDENGNESTGILSAEVLSADNTIPHIPQWLRIHNCNDRVLLKWAPVTIPDLAGYKIYRTLNGSQQLLSTIGLLNSFEDTTGTEGVAYTYSVSAFDTAGNEGSKSQTAEGIKGLPDSERILVIVNQNSSDSIEIGEYYKTVRNIPDSHILYVDLPTTFKLSRSLYKSNLHTPVLQFITDNELTEIIHYIVLCKDIPVWVEFRSVDTLLADLYNEIQDELPPQNTIASSPHTYFMSQKRFSSDNGFVLTARLDGPTVSVIKSLIDNAVYAENHSNLLNNGIMWIDNRNLTNDLYNGFYSQAERYIATSILPLKQMNLRYEHNTASALFADNTCMSTQYYYGWYSYWNFKEVFNGYLRPGSIAGHLDSASFYSVQNTGDNNWGIHMISRGATASYGSIAEPYTFAFPVGGIMYDRLLRGFPLIESYWASANTLRWRMILIGDPLYNPYKTPPIPDTTPPFISNITSHPSGFFTYAISWESDEPTEHSVDYFTDNDSIEDTGYAGWFSRDAHIVIPDVVPNIVYNYAVKSRDLSGNESISTIQQFMYTDTDNDTLEDSWEITHFSSIVLFNGTQDPDNDSYNNSLEFSQGTNPLAPDTFAVDTSNNTTKIALTTSPDREYRIYYTDSLSFDTNLWNQAGPYRLGTGTSITWTDDGNNTTVIPEDPSVKSRIYRFTSKPLSR
ncbi:MAG: TIGR03790 family protein [bacterium]|nr:TIGR03790 family protein [bacterium]